MKILPVVIIYNEDYYKSRVYNSLLKYYPSIRVVLYDNSLFPINEQYSENVTYFHDKTNGGVSAGYNYASKIAKELGNIDFLLLLDQDTLFSSDYIDVLVRTIEKYPQYDLLIPQVVYKDDKPFSPIRRKTLFNSAVFLNEGEYELKGFLPVNTGVCIRNDVFLKAGGYNYRIRLDFADFDFFSRLNLYLKTFYLVNSKAIQSFSNEEHDISKLKKRFKLYIEGAKYAFRNKLIRKDVAIDVIKHTVALTLRNKNLDFINYLIQNI